VDLFEVTTFAIGHSAGQRRKDNRSPGLKDNKKKAEMREKEKELSRSTDLTGPEVPEKRPRCCTIQEDEQLIMKKSRTSGWKGGNSKDGGHDGTLDYIWEGSWVSKSSHSLKN